MCTEQCNYSVKRSLDALLARILTPYVVLTYSPVHLLRAVVLLWMAVCNYEPGRDLATPAVVDRLKQLHLAGKHLPQLVLLARAY